MDLRPFLTTAADVETATKVLNYQPFIISDDIQTGVAYSWLYSQDPRVLPPLVFKKQEWAGEWDKINDANGRLRRQYEYFIGEIARRYPGGSLLDVGCNNGYFPARAQMMGMGQCAGLEVGGHRNAVLFLNRALGTKVEFMQAAYDPAIHQAPVEGTFDVTVASAVLLHLPDPLHFLSFLGSISKEAVFFYGRIVETDAFIIAYRKPHQALSTERPFPHCFNDDTRLSRGLLFWSLEKLGFRDIVEFPWRDDWIPNGRPSVIEQKYPEGGYSKTIAVLAMR